MGTIPRIGLHEDLPWWEVILSVLIIAAIYFRGENIFITLIVFIVIAIVTLIYTRFFKKK